MRLLLINTNPAVSRLITLSVQKMGFSLSEITSLEAFDGTEYDIAMIDSDLYDEDGVSMIKNMDLCSHLVYIGSRGSEKPIQMDSMLEKPFLPTDFIEMLDAINKNLTIKPSASTEVSEIEEELEEELPEELETFPELDEMEIDLDDKESFDGILSKMDDAEEEDFDSLASLDESDSLENEEDSLDDVESLLDEESEEPFEDEFLAVDKLGSLEEDEAAVLADAIEEKPTVLDSDEIREVKELLEETPAEEESAIDELDDIESLELGDLEESLLEEGDSEEEQSLESLVEEIDGMEATSEESVSDEEKIDDLINSLDDLEDASDENVEEASLNALEEDQEEDDGVEALGLEDLEDTLEEELPTEELLDELIETPVDIDQGDDLDKGSGESADEFNIDELTASLEDEDDSDALDLEEIADVSDETVPQTDILEDGLDVISNQDETKETLDELVDSLDALENETEEKPLNFEDVENLGESEEHVPEEAVEDDENDFDIDALMEETLSDSDSDMEEEIEVATDKESEEPFAIEEAPIEDVEIPEEALLEDDEEDMDLEEGVEAPALESIEADEHSKPLPGSDMFDLLDERSLKIALGEAVEDEPEVVEERIEEENGVEESEDVAVHEEMVAQLKSDIEENVTQSLNETLASSDLKEALKGMKININITFEEE